jgi:phosphoglycolate phosphatase
LDVSKSTESSPGGTIRRAVLFDWDGTVVDSVPALFEADSAIARELGLPFDRETFKRTFSPNWRRMYRRMGVAEDQVEQAVAVWARSFDAGETEPFEGVGRALSELARRGFVVGVVTSGSRCSIEPQFARLGLEAVVSVGVFGDDPVEGKPDAAPLLLALERAGGIPPAEAIYVGDALDDMRMAAAAGTRGVGIVSMLADPRELRAAGATDTAASTVAWIERFLGAGAR